MPTITNILTGLSGAGGCAFRSSTSELFYVEYSGNLSKTNPLSPAHTVIGTGYASPEDVELSADGVHAYVTERAGNLVKVSLATPNRSAARVVTSGMTAPQQMALDEAHDTAYVVEYAPSGHLYKVNLTSGVKTAIPVTLNNAVGLAVSADFQYAYVTEQTAPNGRIRKIRLSDGAATVIVSGLVAPFFLTWTDATQTALFVAERDPADRVTFVDLGTNTTRVVAGGFASRPGAVAMMSASRMLVHGETSLSIVDFAPFITSGPLFMGFGFIPYTDVAQSGANLGLATTPSGYFYPVTNAPFAGSLPIMVNYPAAQALGATHYRILVDGVVRTDVWNDQEWNGSTFVLVTTAPTTVNTQPGFYPVRTAPFQFMNPSLGSLVDSTSVSNGNHTIELEFVKPNPLPFATAPIAVAKAPIPPLTFKVDNNPCRALLQAPNVGANVADACGILRYVNATDKVSMPFIAAHPNNFADFSYSLVRGHTGVTAPAISGATSGPVGTTTNPGTISGTVSDLLGTCAGGGMAAFAEQLYVAARATNGWGRQSQYDASDLLAFTLAK